MVARFGLWRASARAGAKRCVGRRRELLVLARGRAASSATRAHAQRYLEQDNEVEHVTRHPHTSHAGEKQLPINQGPREWCCVAGVRVSHLSIALRLCRVAEPTFASRGSLSVYLSIYCRMAVELFNVRPFSHVHVPLPPPLGCRKQRVAVEGFCNATALRRPPPPAAPGNVRRLKIIRHARST